MTTPTPPTPQTPTPNPAKVTVYRTLYCPFCIMAAEFFAARQIPIHEIYLDDHEDRRAATVELLPGHYTVPLILIGDQAIGGLDDLMALDRAGKLEVLLASLD